MKSVHIAERCCIVRRAKICMFAKIKSADIEPKPQRSFRQRRIS